MDFLAGTNPGTPNPGTPNPGTPLTGNTWASTLSDETHPTQSSALGEAGAYARASERRRPDYVRDYSVVEFEQMHSIITRC